MRRSLSLLLALLTMMLPILSGCGGENSASGAGHSFAYTLVGNPDTLDPQLAVSDSAKTVLANLFEGLLTLDDSGGIAMGVAESYQVSEDELRYSFKLRRDSYWHSAMENADAFSTEAETAVTAMDFVFAFQRMFDPVYQSPYRAQFSCIENAEAIINGVQDSSMIGVYAKKDDELEIVLAEPNAGFPLLLTSTAALPCNAEYFGSTKGRYGLDEESVIGNGSFSMQRWLYDPYGKYNVIQLCRNPLYHKNRRVSPIDLTFYIEKTDADAAEIFSRGATDCYVTTNSALCSDPNLRSFGAYSLTLGLIAAPQSRFDNADILHALSIGFDRGTIPHNTDVEMAAGILPPAVTLLNKSCRELISDAAYLRYDAEKAKTSLQAGIAAMGLRALDEGKILVPSGLIDYTVLRDVLKQIEETLAIHLSIEEAEETEYADRLKKGEFELALYTLTGEDYDAASVFRAFLRDDHIGCTQERPAVTQLEKAAAVKNLADCVEIYRITEEALLSDSCFVPLFYKQRYLICKKGAEDIHINHFTGQLRFTDAKFYES